METWHDTANVITGILTALFTGLGAWLVWRQQKDPITVEWDIEYPNDNTLWVRGNVRNHTDSTLKVWRLDAIGPIMDVQPSSKEPKHSSWASNASPLHCEPPPGGVASFSVKVTPDWETLAERSNRWHSRLRTKFAHAVWKSLSRRVHHGASLHFQITIDSKSNRRFRRRMSEKVFIAPETAKRKAAEVKTAATK
jgi:hypothetical protein